MIIIFTQWLINRFVPQEGKNKRQRYGYLGGIIGIIVNFSLFLSKFIIGSLLNSVAITADAFNNLSDIGSSIVTIVGFKIADKPADKDHPFGHGRGEYIAGLIVSFMVLLVGFQFVKDSIDRILHPAPLAFDLLSFLVLILSIGAKAWLGLFNKRLGKEISSGTLSATSFDSFSDVIITTSVAISLLISKFISFPIDGYAGLLVSIFILYAGYNLVKDTISPLLGEAPPPELVRDIVAEVVSFEGITGAHDLIVHSYGAGKYMATIHAEVSADMPIMDAHELIDIAENKISKKLDILLVIHMDPVNTQDEEINECRKEIKNLLKQYDFIESFHDFRVIGTKEHKNILFDIVVTNDVSNDMAAEYVKEIKEKISHNHPGYKAIIGVDRNYVRISGE